MSVCSRTLLNLEGLYLSNNGNICYRILITLRSTDQTKSFLCLRSQSAVSDWSSAHPCCRWNYCFHHSVCLHHQVPLWACSESCQLPAEWGPRPTRWPQHLRLCPRQLPWPTFLQGVVGLEGAAGSGPDYELQSPGYDWPRPWCCSRP